MVKPNLVKSRPLLFYVLRRQMSCGSPNKGGFKPAQQRRRMTSTACRYESVPIATAIAPKEVDINSWSSLDPIMTRHIAPAFNFI